MVMEFVVKRLKSLVLLLLGAFRRALCCFRHRRRSSCDSIPLSNVGVVPISAENNPEFQKWDQWDDNIVVVVAEKPLDPIQEKIQQYRQQVARPPENQDQEKQEDYFEDMTPKITRQTKLLIKNKNKAEEVRDSSKFAVVADPIPTSELGEWEENSTGWEGQTMEEFSDPTAYLREERRKERERKLLEQHQRRMERNYRPQPLGAKVKVRISS